jgi:hypothetical protein
VKGPRHLNLPLHDRKLQSFDKGMPQPKNRAEEKKQKAEQLANLLRIQKELSSDYKVCACTQPPPPPLPPSPSLSVSHEL